MTPISLYYWPHIPGRGEFVRIALEVSNTEYVDVARTGDPGSTDAKAHQAGIAKLMAKMKPTDPATGIPPLSPPFIQETPSSPCIAHVALILFYLAPKIGLAPKDEISRIHAHQIQLTIADIVAEAHDCHHPIATGLYYEDQKEEAKAKAAKFVKERIPKYLGYLEKACGMNNSIYFFGDTMTYVDTSVFHLLEGLLFMFPNGMRPVIPTVPKLMTIHASVKSHPRVHEYLTSPRRLPFNNNGIFRNYPELDPEIK